MSTLRRAARVTFVAACGAGLCGLLAGGCAQILGFEDHELLVEQGEGGAGGNGSGGAAGGGATGGGGSSTSTSGGGMPAPGAGYVAMSGTDNLMAFDERGAVPPAIDLLPQGDYPYDATLSPDGSELWVVGASGDGVIVVATASNQIIRRVALGTCQYPVDVLFSRNGNAAYVSCRDSDELVIVDTGSFAVTGSIPLAGIGSSGPGKMALDPCTDTIWMAEWYSDSIAEIDPINQTTDFTTMVGQSLWDVAVRPSSAGSTLYIGDRGADRVRIVDVMSTNVDSVVVGDDPWGIDVTSDGSTVVVVCEDDSSVHFLDTTSKQVDSINLPVDASPRDVDITADGAYAYLPSGRLPSDGAAVYEILIGTRQLTNTLSLANLGMAPDPNAIAVTPDVTVCP